MKERTKILIYLAAWKRPEITKVCYLGLKRLILYAGLKGYDIEVFVVLSEEEQINIVKRFGFHYVYADNKPLGRKLNAGLHSLLELDFDYLMTLGTDDLLANDIFDLYDSYFAERSPFFGLNRIYFANSETGDIIYHTAFQCFGGARCIRRDVLERSAKNYKIRYKDSFSGPMGPMPKGKIEFVAVDRYRVAMMEKVSDQIFVKLWTDEKNEGLDYDAELKILRAHNNDFHNYRPRIPPSDRAYIIDIKSPVNIHDFGKFEGEKVKEKGEILNRFPELSALKRFLNQNSTI